MAMLRFTDYDGDTVDAVVSRIEIEFGFNIILGRQTAISGWPGSLVKQ